MPDILVLYYSHRGSVRALAERVARGIESVPGAQARLRTVPRVSTVCEVAEAAVPDCGAPYVEAADLEECLGLALGSLTAAAWAHGVGSCIMGAIDRPALTKLLALPDGVRLCYMVALGYPTHASKLVEMQGGSVKYYLDENRGYCVPKRSMDEVLLKTL